MFPLSEDYRFCGFFFFKLPTPLFLLLTQISTLPRRKFFLSASLLPVTLVVSSPLRFKKGRMKTSRKRIEGGKDSPSGGSWKAWPQTWKLLTSDYKPCGKTCPSHRDPWASLVSKEHMTPRKVWIGKLYEITLMWIARNRQSRERERKDQQTANNHVYSMRRKMWVTAIMLHRIRHVLYIDCNLK